MKLLDESLLGAIPPFKHLSREQIREILDLASSHRFEINSAVFEEAMPATRFYLLLDGYIRVLRTTEDGDEVIALHIASGQLFGIAAALGKTTYPATAVAAAECLALSWPMSVWDEFAEKYQGFSTETYKIVGARLEEMQNRIVDMATKDVEHRVANAMLRLINQSGRKIDTGIEINFPITRQNISDMTGTTLHTVSRLLSAWEKDGIVASTRRKVVVTDPHRLVEISDS